MNINYLKTKLIRICFYFYGCLYFILASIFMAVGMEMNSLSNIFIKIFVSDLFQITYKVSILFLWIYSWIIWYKQDKKYESFVYLLIIWPIYAIFYFRKFLPNTFSCSIQIVKIPTIIQKQSLIICYLLQIILFILWSIYIFSSLLKIDLITIFFSTNIWGHTYIFIPLYLSFWILWLNNWMYGKTHNNSLKYIFLLLIIPHIFNILIFHKRIINKKHNNYNL